MNVWFRLVLRHLLRRPGRSVLTAAGVASATLIFASVESLDRGLAAALAADDAARTLIVYRQNRFCPQTSFLPERYGDVIAGVEGVARVLPVKVWLSNCRASLDIVAFHGAPAAALLAARGIEVVAGDVERFRREEDAALIGREFAARRGLAPGDRFRFGDVTVDVAGVFRSDDAVDEGLILTHLEFLQRSGPVDRLGTVTQFEVAVEPGADPEQVAVAIDEAFRTAEEPTATRPRSEFLGAATRELREILRFARAFGVVCVLVMIVLVANTILLGLQERASEFGVYRTLGYSGTHLLRLVALETMLLTLIGALLGLACTWLVVTFAHLSIGVEGVIVPLGFSPVAFARAGGAALIAALAAAALPALVAARTDVHRLLRSA